MKEEKLKKIQSGAMHFYIKEKGMSVMIQMEMADPVDCALLQKALDRTIVRYPYFRVKAVWKDDDIWLADNDAPMVVEDSSEMRRLGSPEIHYHLLEVHAHDHMIYLHFHHGIADGNGMFPMARTLLYTYLCAYYHRDFAPTASINLPDSPIDPGEYAETVPEEFLPPMDEPTIPAPKKMYGLPEYRLTGRKTWFITHVSFPMKEFMRFMKSVDASPAIMLSIFMSQAVERVHPEHEEEIVTQLIWNFRDEIGLPKTHCNCASHVFLTYNDRVKKLPLDRQGTCFRGMTFAQIGEAEAIEKVNQLVGLGKMLDNAKGFEQKAGIMRQIGGSIGQTYMTSYTGQLGMGECEEKIRAMHLYTTVGAGIILEVTSVNETISVDFMAYEDVPVYIDTFCDILKEQGIHFRRGETFEFSFPENGASVAYDARDRDGQVR